MFRAISAILFALLVSPTLAQTFDISDKPAYPALFDPAGGADGARDLVLLGTDLVEIAVALGAADRIHARPDAMDLPGIEDTPVKMRESAGVEGIAAMRPGVVVASNIRYERLLSSLSDLKIRTELIDRVLPATEKVTAMAALLGLEDRGAQLNDAINADYASAEAIERGDRPLRILHASKQGAGGSFSAGGTGTAVHNLIERVGAENAAAEIGMDRYRSVTPEGVILMAPDVVIISAAELPMFGDPEGIWRDYPGLALTPAGQSRRLIIMQELHVRADAASSGIATLALSETLAEMFP